MYNYLYKKNVLLNIYLSGLNYGNTLTPHPCYNSFAGQYAYRFATTKSFAKTGIYYPLVYAGKKQPKEVWFSFY